MLHLSAQRVSVRGVLKGLLPPTSYSALSLSASRGRAYAWKGFAFVLSVPCLVVQPGASRSTKKGNVHRAKASHRCPGIFVSTATFLKRDGLLVPAKVSLIGPSTLPLFKTSLCNREADLPASPGRHCVEHARKLTEAQTLLEPALILDSQGESPTSQGPEGAETRPLQGLAGGSVSAGRPEKEWGTERNPFDIKGRTSGNGDGWEVPDSVGHGQSEQRDSEVTARGKKQGTTAGNGGEEFGVVEIPQVPAHSGRRDQKVTARAGTQETDTRSRWEDLGAVGIPPSAGHSGRRDRHGTIAVNGREELGAVAIPPYPGWRNLGARVEHVLVDEAGMLSDVVSRRLGLSKEYAHRLLQFGAIHWSPVPPKLATSLVARPEHGAAPSDSATPSAHGRNASAGMEHGGGGGELTQHGSDEEAGEEAEGCKLTLKEARLQALALHGHDSRMSTMRRATCDVHVPRWAYIRVHIHPKRFPAAYSVAWKERIVVDGPDFVVVNKPAGVPSVPTVDNVLEDVLACTAKALDLKKPLLTTSRLDNCTEGVIVLGKTPEFVQSCNMLLREDQRVKKQYRALSLEPPPLGLMEHYVTINTRREGTPTHTRVHAAQVPGSLRCELSVEKVERVTLSGAATEMWGPVAYEAVVTLITGRTHQIRAQLAALGCPLLGDTLYGRIPPLQPTAKPLPASGKLAECELQVPRQPEGAIGLQAWQLHVPGGGPIGPHPFCFTVGDPWWRMKQL